MDQVEISDMVNMPYSGDMFNIADIPKQFKKLEWLARFIGWNGLNRDSVKMVDMVDIFGISDMTYERVMAILVAIIGINMVDIATLVH